MFIFSIPFNLSSSYRIAVWHHVLSVWLLAVSVFHPSHRRLPSCHLLPPRRLHWRSGQCRSLRNSSTPSCSTRTTEAAVGFSAAARLAPFYSSQPCLSLFLPRSGELFVDGTKNQGKENCWKGFESQCFRGRGSFYFLHFEQGARRKTL